MNRLFAFLLALLCAGAVQASELRMAVTTSFHNSGLADILLPRIKQDLGLEVHLIVVGTGQALKLGQAGDVDAVLVHARQAEEKFIAAGFGTHRREIMYNDFVLIGPSDDPAQITSAQSAELSLWRQAGLKPEGFAVAWYRAVGAGMGAALNTASGLNAYILADRASWLNFGNKADLALLFAGDERLFNQYAYIPVNPARHPHVKAKLAQELEGWLTGPVAAELINGYQINGQTLFHFNAAQP